MAQAFNLTAQLQLQAPGNTNQVMNQIRRQLKPLGVNLKIQNTKNLVQANRNLQSFSKAAQTSQKNVSSLNRTLQESARRFSVITIATGSFLALANSFKKSVKEAIAFERELVRISQVTGKTVADLKSLSDEVTRLSTSFGASSSSLLNVARTLSQAGFAADETRKALDILAKTSLGATFDNIQDTTEGAIALLRQFSNEARQSGGDIAFLEKSLDAINSVSKKFAVESGDLISAIRRTGGVFSAAGGSVNELIALFTSVRATTRESAETIATGLRTIFTRIQRVETIEQLKALNIQLQDSQGRFVGAFEAVRRLSEGLKFLDPKDFRFSQIVEELGGFRQIGKVIPLINQFSTAQEALNVAQSASGSVSKDAQTAQQSLGVQIQKVREQFDALLRKFQDSSSFRSIAGFAIKLAESFIKVADSLEPLLPLLTSLIGLKLGQGLAPLVGGLAGIGKRTGSAGPISKFARGGMVPGSGNRDTVPAMLTPGEFVIRKSSVKSLGAGTLAAMNQNKFNKGKKISFQDATQGKGTFEFGLAKDLGVARGATLRKLGDGDGDTSDFDIAGAFLKPKGLARNVRGKIAPTEIQAVLTKVLGTKIGGRGNKAQLSTLAKIVPKDMTDGLEINVLAGSTTVAESKDFGRDTRNALASVAQKFASDRGLPFGKKRFLAGYKKANPQQIEGNLFEATLAGASGTPYTNTRDAANAAIDFPTGLGGKLGEFFGLPPTKPTDAKRTYNQESIGSLLKKAATVFLSQFAKDVATINVDQKLIKTSEKQRKLAQPAKKNAGGGIAGSDTVPALLTPGEFVMNKSASQSIGYSALNRMNKQGVKGFAAGGVVTTGRNNYGIPSAGDLKLADFSDTQALNAISGGPPPPGPPDDPFKNLITVSKAVQKRMEDENKRREEVTDRLNDNKISIDKNGNIIDKNNQKRSKLGDSLANLSSRVSKTAKSGVSSVRRGLDRATGGRVNKAIIGTARVSSKEGRQAFAGQVDKIAGTAQQFVFLGSTVAALTGQMSGLDDSTKKAINEVAGFATGIVGIGGTLVQVLTSFSAASSQAAIANQLEAKASLQAGAADQTEALSKNAAAGLGLAKAFGVVAIAVVAVGAALKFFSSRAKAEADKLSKGVSDRLAKVKEEGGTVGGLGDLEAAAKQQQFSERTDPLSEGGLKGILGGAATGAAIGGLIAGPIGIAAGGAIGAALGGLTVYNNAAQELTDSTKRQIESIRGNIGALEGLYNSSLKADQALADIDATRGLSDRDRAIRLTDVSRDLGGDASLPAIKDANIQLALLASSVGKRASEIQESDFEGQALLQFQTASAKAAAGQESVAKRAKVANDALSAAISATDGTKGFDELISAGGTFAQAFNEAKAATIARTQAEIESLGASGASQKEINAARKRGANQLKDLQSGTARVIEAQKAQREELIKSQEAAAAFRAELAKGKAFTAALEEQGRALERQGRAIDDFTANLQGRSTEFRSQEIVGLDNVAEVQNLSRFFAQVDNVAAQAGPEAQKSAEALKRNAKILKGSSLLEGIDATVSNLRQSILGNLSAIGVSEQTFGGGKQGEKVFEKIIKDLEDGVKEGGRLTKEEIDRAFSPVAELVNQQANNFKLINNNQNAQLQNYSKFLDAQDALFNKELEGRARIAEVAAQGAEFRAQARGQELSPQAQEAIRRSQAQVQLSGTGLQAGNLRQVAAAKEQAKQTLRNIQAQKRQADVVGLSVKQRAALAKQERQQLKILSAANGELERLADQSERASSILSQIDDERAKRQAQFEIIQDFVVGGEDERKALNNAALGIQNAVATGSLQGQSAEERSATVGLLDRLANIVIPGTGGLTGEQVKQEVVFRDAVRLGLDPQIAKSIATATSKEQQLINALDKLTEATTQAARARGFATGGMVQYRAGGGSIFQPRGTDTVPAMLTPGEFVIRKSAVDKVGVGALQAINNGNSSVGLARGGVVYRQQGGPIGAGVNAQNVQFGEAVSIMSGDQFQSIVRESVKRLPKNEVLKILSSVKGGENVAKDVRLLLNRGTFPANRLNIGSGTARFLDNLVANKSIFSSASAAGATLRTPNPPAVLGQGANVDDLNIYKEYWQNYRNGLLSAAGSVKFQPSKELAANELVKKTTGMDVMEISTQLRRQLLDRAEKIENFLNSITEKAGTVEQRINIAKAGFGLQTNVTTDAQKAQAEKLKKAGFSGLDRVSQGAINRLQKSGILFSSGGKVPYFATGGSVGGDSVPAMLTPGEFVMSAGAVKKHGVGFMNTLNRGQVQGFNKGGPVQYRQTGGIMGMLGGAVQSLGIDTSKIEGVFGGFVDNLSSVFDNIVSPLSSVVQALNQMSQSFGNFTMQHTVTVDGLISLGGLNVESIKNELSKSIGEMVGDEVKRALDDKNKTFKSN